MATAYSFASCVPVVSDSSLSLSFFRSIRCGRLVPGMSLATSPSGLRCYGSHGASDATVTDRKHFTQLPLWQRFRGFVELTRKPIFPRTLFFTQQGQRSECWQKEALAYIYIYILYYIYSDIFASCLHLSWKLLLDLLASRNTSEIIWHDCSSFRIIPQMDSRD